MSAGRPVSRGLIAFFAAALIVAVVAFGALIVQDFNRALEPELERRSDLIGTTVRDDVDRALDLGIPLARLAGMEPYTEALMEDFEELDAVLVRDRGGGILHASGSVDADSEVSTYDVGPVDERAGSVVLAVDRSFASGRLQDLALDLAVIVVVVLVLAYELALAVGERVSGETRRTASLDVRLVLFVFVVGEELSKSFLPQFVLTTTDPGATLDPALAVSLPIVAYLLTLGLASPVAGQLADRFGERRLLLAGMAIAALAGLGMVVATDLPQTVVLRGLTGVGYALATVACFEYLLSRRSDVGRARAMGAFVAVVMGGTFAGTALGGILADRLGYRPVFFIGVVVVLAAALLAWRTLEARRAVTDESEAGRAGLVWADLLQVLRQPRLLALLAGVTVPMNVLMAAFLWYLVPLTLAGAGEGAAVIGRTLMLYYLVVLLVSPLASRLTEAVPDPRVLLAAGAIVSGAALWLPASALTVPTVTLAVIVVGIGHAAIRAPQLALAVELGEADGLGMKARGSIGRGPTLAAMRLLERLGSLVGLLLAALVAASMDLLWAMAALGVAVVVAGMAYLATVARRQRDLAHA